MKIISGVDTIPLMKMISGVNTIPFMKIISGVDTIPFMKIISGVNIIPLMKMIQIGWKLNREHKKTIKYKKFNSNYDFKLLQYI